MVKDNVNSTFVGKKCEVVTLTYTHKGIIKAITTDGVLIENNGFTNIFTGNTTVKFRFIPMLKVKYIITKTVRKNKKNK